MKRLKRVREREGKCEDAGPLMYGNVRPTARILRGEKECVSSSHSQCPLVRPLAFFFDSIIHLFLFPFDLSLTLLLPHFTMNISQTRMIPWFNFL